MDTDNMRVIHDPAEAATAKRDAYAAFAHQLQGSGLQVTPEAVQRWWGVDEHRFMVNVDPDGDWVEGVDDPTV